MTERRKFNEEAIAGDLCLLTATRRREVAIVVCREDSDGLNVLKWDKTGESNLVPGRFVSPG